MKNPLKPTYIERERPLDRFEMEHHADLQIMMPDFDVQLRAHEELHDPLNEFTKDSLRATLKVNITGTAELTVGLTGVAATAEAGTFERGKKSWISEEKLQELIELSKPTPPPKPLVFDDARKFVQLFHDPKIRKKSMKRIGDEEAELQMLLDEGQAKTVLWRRTHMWFCLVTEFASNYVLPVMRTVKKWMGPIWALIVWLTTWH